MELYKPPKSARSGNSSSNKSKVSINPDDIGIQIDDVESNREGEHEMAFDD